MQLVARALDVSPPTTTWSKALQVHGYIGHTYWDGIYNARIKVCHSRVLEHTDSKEIDGYRWISYVFGLGNQDHSRSFPSSKYISMGSMEPPFWRVAFVFFSSFYFVFFFLEAQNYYQQSCIVHRGRRKRPVCVNVVHNSELPICL